MANFVENNYENELAMAIMASLQDEQGIEVQAIQESIRMEEERIAIERAYAESVELARIIEIANSADQDSRSEQTECAICINEFNESTMWDCPHCRFSMCEGCAIHSFSNDSRCPNCRNDCAGVIIDGREIFAARLPANNVADDEALARELQDDFDQNDIQPNFEEIVANYAALVEEYLEQHYQSLANPMLQDYVDQYDVDQYDVGHSDVNQDDIDQDDVDQNDVGHDDVNQDDVGYYDVNQDDVGYYDVNQDDVGYYDVNQEEYNAYLQSQGTNAVAVFFINHEQNNH
jgi:hypothetical protein